MTLTACSRSVAYRRALLVSRGAVTVTTNTARFQSSRPDVSTKSSSSNSSSSSLFESANELFSSLRWKAANALTLSLSEEERQRLLARIHPAAATKDAESSAATAAPAVPEAVSPKSIAEAVAAARLEEAQKHETKWKAEREQLLAEADRAARARVESELATQQRRMQFEQWQKAVEAERRSTMNVEPVTVEAQVVEETSHENTSLSKEHHHPILGPVVKDLGTKRLYLVSADTLENIPVWEKQRTFRPDRAKSMAQDKMKTLHLGWLGAIVLHEDANGKLTILDGQHRVGMMNYLREKVDLDGMGGIVVEVYSQSADDSPNHAQDIFLEINKAEPVKLIDLPGYASEADRKAITDGAMRLKDKFPDMFKESEKCRAPHVNIDNLRDHLFSTDVVKRHGLKSGAAVEKWMMEQNKLLAAKYAKEDERAKVNDKVLAKADKFQFYLGLDPSWLYN